MRKPLQSPNGRVLIYLVEFLQELGTPEIIKATKMTLQNLATVFSPLLLRCPFDDPALVMKNSEYENRVCACPIAKLGRGLRAIKQQLYETLKPSPWMWNQQITKDPG